MVWEDGQLLMRARHVGVVYNRANSLFKKDPYWALKDISFDLHAGESLGIVGRNGVGKSTLLKILADIIRPDRGTVENFGASIALLSMQAGFDKFASGRRNILISGLLLGYAENEINDRLQDIIDYAGIREFIDQPVGSYSTGMRARLGFSICYFLNTDIMLIDEALGAGDLEFRRKSVTAMKEKIQSDQTIVLVSHEPKTIRSLCDRAIWIEDGKSLMEGNAVDVVKAYEAHVMKIRGMKKG